MRPKTLATTLVAAGLLGCTLTGTELRRGNEALPPLAGQGRLITPKRCVLELAILTRPHGDPAVGEALWRLADDQAVGDEVRRALEANNLQVGVISGELPAEVRALMRGRNPGDSPPPDQASIMTVAIPSGDSSLVDLDAAADRVSLMHGHDGKVVGKVYRNARGYERLTASHHAATGVTLQIVPELRHGAVRQGYAALPTTGEFGVREFTVHSGQEEETFPDLAAELVLEPGQTAVVGSRTGLTGGLGGFLFSAEESNGERRSRVLLIRAGRSGGGGPEPPGGLVPAPPPEA